MNKMNKKGFTLIEMLVVIAIIAVLVSIVIPVVGSSTARAEAATDAANLRSAQASLTIAVLNGDVAKPASGSTTGTWPTTGSYGSAPVAKTKNAGAFGFTVSSDGQVTVYFGSATNDINHFADLADNGKADGSNGATPSSSVAPGGDQQQGGDNQQG